VLLGLAKVAIAFFVDKGDRLVLGKISIGILSVSAKATVLLLSLIASEKKRKNSEIIHIGPLKISNIFYYQAEECNPINFATCIQILLFHSKNHLKVNYSKRNANIPQQSANLKANNPHSLTTHPADNFFAILCLCVFSGGRERYAHLLALRRRRLHSILHQIRYFSFS